MKKSTRKVLSLLLISLFGLVVGVAVSFYILLRLSVPVTSGEMAIEGISRPVEITFDSMGVCQIWAETAEDAYFALGYQHAADRMFQMDVSRRLAGGRLSEILGSVTIEIDSDQRRIGHHRMARMALPELSENNRRRLQAYADGINAYYRHCRAVPFEYRFLPVKFVEWTVEDCLTLLSFQNWFSNALMSRDEFYSELSRKIGPQKAASLHFPYPDWAPATVTNERDIGYDVDEQSGTSYSMSGVHPFSELSGIRQAVAASLFANRRYPLRMTESSNAWVVAPSKSASGKAMLASDPHLELSRLPQFWYAAGLHIKEDSTDVVGITTAGLPFFVMGHNGNAAWAFTAGGIDIVDYYLEDINPENFNEYRVGDSWWPFDIVADSFYVADVDSVVYREFRYTINGPVMEIIDSSQAVSLRWAGFDSDFDADVTNGFELSRIDSFDQFRQVVTGLGALDANMLYADASGNIGYQLGTPLPVRSTDDGNASPRWEGYYPIGATPWVLNPPEGWIASANNLPQRLDYVRGNFFTNRILSITNLLESKELFTSDDMRRFQMDRTDRHHLMFAPLAVDALKTIGKTDEADMMRSWDGSMATDSKAAAIMEVFLARLKEATFEDELGSHYYQVPGQWTDALPQVDSAGWFDDVATRDTVESQANIAARAMTDALALTQGATWGDIHTLSMQHPLSVIPLLGDWLGLSRGPVPWGGSSGSLCASFSRSSGEGRFESVAGPSWRFVIDFANVDSVTVVLPAGNSGNPMSAHFFDFNEMWQTGRYWVLPINYEKVRARAVSTLILTPPTE